jgi:hypothetical protein
VTPGSLLVSKLKSCRAFEKQLFTEWMFPPIVDALIVALGPLPGGGLIE